MCAREQRANQSGVAQAQPAADANVPLWERTEANAPPTILDGVELTPIDLAATQSLPGRLGAAEGASGTLADVQCLGQPVRLALWQYGTAEAADAAFESARAAIETPGEAPGWLSGKADGQLAAVARFADDAGKPWIIGGTGDALDAVAEAVSRARGAKGLTYPATADDWALAEPAKAYDRVTVFDPIDGGAEQYFRYSFIRFYRGHYAKDQAGITVDVYEETTSPDAWGVQSAFLTKQPADVGQAGYVAPMQLTFWQGPYFCRLKCERRFEGSAEALLVVARALSDALVVRGTVPDMTALISGIEPAPASVHYFHEAIDLSQHFYISTSDVLGLGNDTDCLVAKLPGEGRGPALLAVRFPKGDRAAKALGGLAGVVLGKDAVPEGGRFAAEWDPGKWTVARVAEGTQHDWLLASFGTPTQDAGEKYLGAMTERAQ